MSKFLSAFLLLPLMFAVPVSHQYLLPRATNVEKLEMIRVIGIDQMGEGVRLSLAAASQKGGDEKEGGGEENFIIHGSGMTFHQAVEDAQRGANKLLFWGHADIVVLGEETAKTDISKYIDFLVRDQKTRLSARVLTVKEGSAEDLLKRKGHEKQAIYDGLTEQLQYMKENSLATEVSLSDVISAKGNDRTGYLMPTVVFEGEESYEIDGAAVLHNGKIVDFLSGRSARAALLVRGKFYRGLDILETDLLGRISIDAGGAHVEKKFYEEDSGNVACDITIKLSGTLSEQFDDALYEGDRYTSGTMADVSLAWSKKLEKELWEVIAYDKLHEYDALGLVDDLYRSDESLYMKYQTTKRLNVYLKVDAQMQRIHVLDQEL